MKQGIRWVLYTLGMLVLALGLTLNTKTGLGVSPIISVAFGVSEIWGLNFGDVTFLLYGLFVAGQIALRRGRGWLADLLQLPLSLRSFPTAVRPTAFGRISCCWRPRCC